MTFDSSEQRIRHRRRIEDQSGNLFLRFARKPNNLDFGNRLLRGILSCGHDEIADRAALDFGRAPDDSQCLRSDPGFDAGCACSRRLHTL